ncbi:hypothetical protein VNO80_13386 [Phaseolus coccineus]|uniref:Uncharacterized protein n=1 Tax=Phaseolus coccineus TaxID=3886 RepID=A0AAN9N2W9_PHACN
MPSGIQREGLMSYKQFIQELENDILLAEAQRRRLDALIVKQPILSGQCHADGTVFREDRCPLNLGDLLARRLANMDPPHLNPFESLTEEKVQKFIYEENKLSLKMKKNDDRPSITTPASDSSLSSGPSNGLKGALEEVVVASVEVQVPVKETIPQSTPKKRQKDSKGSYKKKPIVVIAVASPFIITVDDDNTEFDDMVFSSLRKGKRSQQSQSHEQSAPLAINPLNVMLIDPSSHKQSFEEPLAN